MEIIIKESNKSIIAEIKEFLNQRNVSFFVKNNTEKHDPTKMSKEEFFAKIDNGLYEYQKGKFKKFDSFNDFKKYISK